MLKRSGEGKSQAVACAQLDVLLRGGLVVQFVSLQIEKVF